MTFCMVSPFPRSDLLCHPASAPLHLYAAPLFRMALTGHLDLKMDRRPAREGETDYEAYRALYA